MHDRALSGKFRDGVHVLPVRIYYEDTDFSGVVYHANYLRFMERGRSDYLRLMGVHHHELAASKEPVSWAVMRMEIDFLKPARIDDALEVHTAYTKLTGASIYAQQSIKRGDEELVRADLQAACVTPNGRAARIPRTVRQAILRHIDTGSDAP